MVGRWNYLLRTLVLGGMVALGYLGWLQVQQVLGSHQREVAERDDRIQALADQLSAKDSTIAGLQDELSVRQERIDALVVDVAERDARIGELDLALRYLKLDHRLARLSVLGQTSGEEGRAVETTVRFEELGPDGEPVGEGVTTTLPGRFAYIESLVIKFDDDFVEHGDVWRGTSLCLFRRLFSEQQRPEQGLPLDRVGERPLPYSDDRDPELVDRLWLRFWDYANDPEQAAAAGVRALHGEAPFIELRPGRSYLVELRASGGLSLRTE